MQSINSLKDLNGNVTTSPVSILLFGFSVTADKAGYGIYLSDILKDRFSRPVTIDICGIGGVDVEFAAVTIEDILAEKHYNIILLEVLTGQDRALRLTTDRFMEAYRSLLAKISQHSCMPVVVELYRGEVDLRRDNIRHAVLSLNRHLGIPTLSLFEEMRDKQIESKDLLKDTVHTTDAGALYYAKKIGRFLAEVVLTNFTPTAPLDLPDICKCLLVARSPAVGSRQKFYRTGYSLEYMSIAEGYFIDIPFPEPVSITGYSYLMGPDAGKISLGTPDNPQMRSIIAVDRYSYYYRVHSTNFEPFTAKIVRITQVGPCPEVKLNKGAFVPGPTVGRIGHLMFSP